MPPIVVAMLITVAMPLPDRYDAPATKPLPGAPARDRWMDAVRAAALVAVVLGHWLLAVVSHDPDGDLQVRSLLTAAPGIHWVSLGVQVMGAFFLIGGAVSVRSWRRARSAAPDVGTWAVYGGWLRTRAGRLVGPALPLMAAWAVATPALAIAGLDPGLAAAAGTSALAPLWFLVTYLLVQALVPAIELLVTRVGWKRATAALIAGSALVDLAVRGHDLTWAGYGGYLTVWVVPVVLGVALADGHLGVRQGRWLAGLGAAGLVGLVGAMGYPLLMVGTLPDGGSNQNPPSLALAMLILSHVGLLLLTRQRVTGWLSGPRAARLTTRAAAWSLPLFLYHMSAMALAIGASLITPWATAGLMRLAPLGPLWWLTRPLWWLVMAAWTLPLLMAAQRHDRRQTAPAMTPGATTGALLGCVLAMIGIAVGSAHIATPAVSLVMTGLLWAGAALLGCRPARRVS